MKKRQCLGKENKNKKKTLWSISIGTLRRTTLNSATATVAYWEDTFRVDCLCHLSIECIQNIHNISLIYNLVIDYDLCTLFEITFFFN